MMSPKHICTLLIGHRLYARHCARTSCTAVTRADVWACRDTERKSYRSSNALHVWTIHRRQTDFKFKAQSEQVLDFSRVLLVMLKESPLLSLVPSGSKAFYLNCSIAPHFRKSGEAGEFAPPTSQLPLPLPYPPNFHCLPVYFLGICFLPFSDFSTQFNSPSDPSLIFTTSGHIPLLINVLLKCESWFYGYLIYLYCMDNLSVQQTESTLRVGTTSLSL